MGAVRWDEEKAPANVRKHGIAFEFAVQVFESAVQAEWLDDREDYGEERWNVVGLIAGFEGLVTYTLRVGGRTGFVGKETNKV